MYVKLYIFYSLDSKQMVQKYGSIIIDFAYFKSTSTYEEKIENDPVRKIIQINNSLYISNYK